MLKKIKLGLLQESLNHHYASKERCNRAISRLLEQGYKLSDPKVVKISQKMDEHCYMLMVKEKPFLIAKNRQLRKKK